MKDYTSTVDETQVLKAFKDMNKNRDCKALIFVSKNSDIRNHQKPGHFDMTIENGSIVVWIGHFDRHVNKVEFLQMIGHALRTFAKLQRKVASDSSKETLENLNEKLNTIREDFKDTKVDLDDMKKTLKECQKENKKTWDKMALNIETIILLAILNNSF
jgi:PAB1-binding protein PBP1